MAPKRAARANLASGPVSGPETGNNFSYRVPTEDHDKRRIVRIGTLPGSKDESNPDALPMKVVVVAMVDPDEENDITYYSVDTWRINGHRIGDYSSADVIESIYDHDGLEVEAFFSKSYRDAKMTQKILAGVKKQASQKSNAGSDVGLPKGKHAPKKAPFRPSHSLGSWPLTDVPTIASDEDINVVICFLNDLSATRMGLPRNLQAALDYNESQSSFRQFINDIPAGEENDTTVKGLVHSDKFPFWAEFEFWVLPQGANEMVKWTAGSGLQAQDFLDPGFSARHGRQLYIQVRIKEAYNASQKNKEWWSSLSAKEKKQIREPNTAAGKKRKADPEVEAPGRNKRAKNLTAEANTPLQTQPALESRKASLRSASKAASKGSKPKPTKK